MTAEVVVMNTSAVALAADSAVTFTTSADDTKTSISANKLFNLSYGHSVGVMIYHRASIYSVPWETILKVYRDQGHIEHCDTLSEYVDNFISFLNNEEFSWLFPEELLNAGLQSKHTGIVFAGFGKKEVFPSLRYFETCGFDETKKLVIQKDECKAINENTNALVETFAQGAMTKTFIDGILPAHRVIIERLLVDAISKIPEKAINEIPDSKFDAQQSKNDLRAKLLVESKDAMDEAIQKLKKLLYNNYTKDIYDGISVLNKDELADVAGALLRVSTLHKQVSLHDDSVGEPIDLAVITKGEGMIWIKRKHYFNKDLNPQYFKRFADRGEINDK